MGFFNLFQGSGREMADIQPVDVIDFDALLAEIDPEHPCGEQDLEYDPAFIGLEAQLKGTPEVEIGGKIVQEAKGPNWSEVRKAAGGLLGRTHDLRVAVYLTRALLHTEGLIGLRDGLKLLRLLVEPFWETLHPQLDPHDHDDPTRRINIVMALCDRESFIVPLMGVPLCASARLGMYALRDIHAATGKNAPSGTHQNQGAPGMATIEAACTDCDLQALLANAAAVAEALRQLDGLERILKEKVGPAGAPQFEDLRLIMTEIEEFLSRQLGKRDDFKASKKKQLETRTAVVKNTAPVRAVSFQGVESMERITSHQDITRMLDLICLYYEKNEPASPVPLLLQRAKRLVAKNFFEIMQDVAPESISQIKKLLGDPKGDT